MSPVLLDERRQQILDLVMQQGFVSLQDLVECAGASESTVRRDLDYLDDAGRLRRTRGGAAALVGQIVASGSGATVIGPNKSTIARRAAELLNDGETVLIDGGSTTHAFARELIDRQFNSLQIVTNSIALLGTLASADGIELVSLGGVLQPKSGVLLGPMTTAALRDLNVRKLVMGTGGIQETGLYNSNSLLVETERQMIEAADEVIVVAESTKFGHSELVHLCNLDRVDCLVTDGGLSDEWRRRLEDIGARVIIATATTDRFGHEESQNDVDLNKNLSPPDAGRHVMSSDDRPAWNANFESALQSSAAFPTA